MALLIDGYNLLHVTGLTGRRTAGLQGSREALLRFLAASLPDAVRVGTTIVFDAAEAPPGLPRVVVFEDMTVRYASEYPDADALLEELIAADYAPRRLTVVSSDHRVQRAARRRRAATIDSDVWFGDALRRRTRTHSAGATPLRSKPAGPLSEAEIAYWMSEFAVESEDGESRRAAESDVARSGGDPESAEPTLDNPFPPGYGEDLLLDE
jgi:predicted RNA-binding protein with PIN domain